MTATRQPRRSSPGWAMTALRGAIRILRYVNETLVLVLQALFPRPAHDDPARRQTRPQKGMPTSLPSRNTAALAVVVLALGRAARGHGARRLAGVTVGRGPCGSRVVARPVRPRPAAGRRAASGGDSSGAGSIFELVSRIDGAKMLLLAIVAVSAIALARRAGALPAWTVYPTACWRSHRPDRGRLPAAEPGVRRAGAGHRPAGGRR